MSEGGKEDGVTQILFEDTVITRPSRHVLDALGSNFVVCPARNRTYKWMCPCKTRMDALLGLKSRSRSVPQLARLQDGTLPGTNAQWIKAQDGLSCSLHKQPCLSRPPTHGPASVPSRKEREQ